MGQFTLVLESGTNKIKNNNHNAFLKKYLSLKITSEIKYKINQYMKFETTEKII